MKIGVVTPGGVDRSGTHRVIPCLLWLVERLARRHEVHVFALRHERRASRYPLLGARVHNVGRPGWRLRALAAIHAEHRSAPFDVLHALWAVPSGVIAAAASRLVGAPLLLHLPGGDLAALPEIDYGLCRTRRGRSWLRFAAAGARRVVVPSEEMRRRACERGIRAERVPFGVALDRWPERAPRRRSPAEPARLLFVGSLNRVKDPCLLLEAAGRLREEGVPFRLDVVGEDVLGGEVERRISDLDLGRHVTLRGFLPHADLHPVVAEADLLVVSSRHEAGPVVALEAAVAGVPTVGTRVGHLADWAPEAAVAVPVGDAEALARAVIDLLDDEARRLALARRARRLALAEDADWTAGRIEEIYRKLVSSRVRTQDGSVCGRS